MVRGTEEAERSLHLADEAMARSDVEGTVAHLSAAIRQLTAADDKCGAAMACVRLGDTFAHQMGNLTASRAWYARAWRLVEHEPPCLEQGWVAVASMGCDVDDPSDLLRSAELAIERARRFGDVNLETRGLADAGLAHVQAGRISEGMALLDEAMALACGPADDAEAAAKSVCSFFTACYFAADFGRAGSWATLLRDRGLISGAPGGPVFLSGHCDSVQASLLMELGRWSEAEAVLTRARAEFENAMQMPSWHPEIALADLRIRQGRFTDAEALLLGKDQAMQALLPAAHLHLARGDHELARAAALRGLRVVGDDRVRASELLTVLVDAELARGDVDAAIGACTELAERTADLDIPALQGRSAAARARALTATGDLDAAIATLESAVDKLDVSELPWRRATLLLDLARLHDRAGDVPAATLDANAAATILANLDVVVAPTDVAVLERLGTTRPPHQPSARTVQLTREKKWWVASCGGSSVRLHDTKGLRYLAELVARPGVERHVLDLVDRVEGTTAAEGHDRRAMGDAGEVLDNRARVTYRRRIEQLRAEADEALAAGLLETAEAKQFELDQLVAQLAQAFGLGGRERRSASAAERARLNVTRALRTAIAKLVDAVPDAGALLDRRVHTGLYCIYKPADDDEFRWIVQS